VSEIKSANEALLIRILKLFSPYLFEQLFT
jgi:hypothetical protein